MEYSNTPAITDDHAIVDRLYDLARNGQTACHEFLQLDHWVFDRLKQTYGGEIQRLHAQAA